MEQYSVTYQLGKREHVGVAVMIGVGENSAVLSTFALVQSLNFCVILPFQRGLTGGIVLEQFIFILHPCTDRQEAELVNFSVSNV